MSIITGSLSYNEMFEGEKQMEKERIKMNIEKCDEEISDLREQFRKSKNTTAREAITLQIKNLQDQKLKHRMFARANGIEL